MQWPIIHPHLRTACDAMSNSSGNSTGHNVQNKEWEVRGDLPEKVLIVALRLPWALAAAALCTVEGPRQGVTPFTRKGGQLSQCARNPNMWDKDHGRPRTGDIDHTQKHPGRKASLKRCSPSVIALLEKFAISDHEANENQPVNRRHFAQFWTNLNEWMHACSFYTHMSGGVGHANLQFFIGLFSKYQR